MNTSLLIGKTITAVVKCKQDNHSDTGYLKLTFSDNTTCYIVASYGSFDVEADDEYPTDIDIKSEVTNLIELPNNHDIT